MSATDAFKKALPTPVKRAIGETLDAVDRAKQWPAAALHPWRRESIRRLRALKDIHRGERCFFIGNGPSLRNTDLSKLQGRVHHRDEPHLPDVPRDGFPDHLPGVDQRPGH